MKKTKFFLVLAALLTTQGIIAQNWWKSSIKGEGKVVEKNLQVDNFNGFTLSFSGDVYIRQGNTQSVRVEAQENIIDNILTDVENNHWRIRFDQPVRSHQGVKVFITMPTLTSAKVSGSGDVVTEDAFVNLGNVEVSVSGSGNLQLDLEAKEISSRVSGSGDIALKGKADLISVGISGSGDVDAYGLAATIGQVQVSGSGDARVHVSEDLEVKISGSGDVTYKGTPRMRSKISGSGDVNSY